MDKSNISVRNWLKQNDYADISECIDIIMEGWVRKGKSVTTSALCKNPYEAFPAI